MPASQSNKIVRLVLSVFCAAAIGAQAAHTRRSLVACGQVESVRPVHGSVLVQKGRVFFAAGRSSYLDRGLTLYSLDLETGALQAQNRLYSRDAQTGRQPAEHERFEMPGAKPDILSSNGDVIFMRENTFDAETLKRVKTQPHLFSPGGFLNSDWWHRNYRIYGTHFYSGYIGWYFAGREAPGGRLLSIDASSMYGFSYLPEYYRGATGRKYHLFASDSAQQPAQPPVDYRRANRDYPHSKKRKFRITFSWSKTIPILARAMVTTKKKVAVAGPPEAGLRDTGIFTGKKGAELHLFSKTNGALLQKHPLETLPVHDGMAASYGKLFIPLENGKLLCLQ